jgi:arsenate reductase
MIRSKKNANRKLILFICAGNKKRSQMAEAIFNHLAKNARAESAGTMPAETVDPLVGEVLAERGISFTPRSPQMVSDTMVREADFIVSFGCLVPSASPKVKFEEWVTDVPNTLDEHRRVRDIILARVHQFIARHNL